MTQNNTQRYACHTQATADMHVRAQKANLLHSPELWGSLGMLVLVAAFSAVTTWIKWKNTQTLAMESVLIVALALGFMVWRGVSLARMLKRTRARFLKVNPEGSCLIHTWVQDEELRMTSKNGQHVIPLSSIRRLVMHKDLAVILTKERQFIALYRKALSDSQWRSFCADVRRENPKFRHPFK